MGSITMSFTYLHTKDFSLDIIRLQYPIVHVDDTNITQIIDDICAQ